MGLEKSIQYGKEKRKRYYGSKAFDPTCRNHGSDEYARNNRLYNARKKIAKMNAQIKDFETEW